MKTNHLLSKEIVAVSPLVQDAVHAPLDNGQDYHSKVFIDYVGSFVHCKKAEPRSVSSNIVSARLMLLQ